MSSYVLAQTIKRACMRKAAEGEADAIRAYIGAWSKYVNTKLEDSIKALSMLSHLHNFGRFNKDSRYKDILENVRRKAFKSDASNISGAGVTEGFLVPTSVPKSESEILRLIRKQLNLKPGSLAAVNYVVGTDPKDRKFKILYALQTVTGQQPSLWDLLRLRLQGIPYNWSGVYTG